MGYKENRCPGICKIKQKKIVQKVSVENDKDEYLSLMIIYV